MCLWCCILSLIFWIWLVQWRFLLQFCIILRIFVSVVVCGFLKCLILILFFFILVIKVFEIIIIGVEFKVFFEQGIIVGFQIFYKEVYECFEEFDVFVVFGGNSVEIFEKEDQFFVFISDFFELQKKDFVCECIILFVCIGFFFLVKEGIFFGFFVIIYFDYLICFENLCSDVVMCNFQECIDVVEDICYVVNNF